MKKKGKHVDETEGKYRSIRQEIVKKKREREGEQTFFLSVSVLKIKWMCVFFYTHNLTLSRL